VRGLLLEIRDRKGWKVLGFESFDDYGKKEWGYSTSQIYRLAQAAETQNSINSPIGELPETHLRVLAKADPEERQAILDTAIAEGGKLTAPKLQAILDKKNQELAAAQKEKNELADQLLTAEEQNKKLKTAISEEAQRLANDNIDAAIADAAAVLESDYCARIDSQTDRIMNLRQELQAAQSKTEEKQRLEQQITEQKQKLEQLKKDQEQVITDQKINQQYINFGEAITDEISKIMTALAVFNETNPIKKKSKNACSVLAVAAKKLEESAKALHFLATGEAQTTIMD
jgi:NADH dehydrogenase/NADH:ubiquinone oxidoreductase subunit G